MHEQRDKESLTATRGGPQTPKKIPPKKIECTRHTVATHKVRTLIGPFFKGMMWREVLNVLKMKASCCS